MRASGRVLEEDQKKQTVSPRQHERNMKGDQSGRSGRGWDHKVGEPWRKRVGEKCGRVKGEREKGRRRETHTRRAFYGKVSISGVSPGAPKACSHTHQRFHFIPVLEPQPDSECQMEP